MSTSKTENLYDEDFKHTLANLYQSNGKSHAALYKEYDISATSLARWIKQYSTVETDDGEVLTARQVKKLQKRNAQLKEESLILKKRLPSSFHTQTAVSGCYKLCFQHGIKLLCKILMLIL